ncbi:MAG: hypothetical protein ACR2K5_04855 [Pseudolabrys sp.]
MFFEAITTWCGTPSLLVQVTGVFGAAVTLPGANLKSAIITLAAVFALCASTCVAASPASAPHATAADTSLIKRKSAIMSSPFDARDAGLLRKDGQIASPAAWM